MSQIPTAAPPLRQTSFSGFYQQVFLPEHQHAGNVALHLLGTVAGLAFVAAVLVNVRVWWALPLLLLFPLIHALPGLLGHRLWERNAAVGDVRVNRKDYSPLWFIAGNHRMGWDLMTKGFYWRQRTKPSEAAARK